MNATYDSVSLATQVPEAIIRNVKRPLLGEVRDIYQAFPGREGSWEFDEKPGDRIINIDIAITGCADVAARRTAVANLATWAYKSAKKHLIFSDESDRYWEAKLDSVSTPDEWVNTAKASLDFRVGPYAKAVSLSTSSVTATNNVDFTVTIADEVEAFPVIQIQALSAMSSGFTLRCNGSDLTYTTAVASSGYVTVDSVAYAVLTGVNTDTDLDGSFNDANLSMAGVDGIWPVLQPGNNTLRIIGADAGVVITRRRRYLQ